MMWNYLYDDTRPEHDMSYLVQQIFMPYLYDDMTRIRHCHVWFNKYRGVPI